MGNMEMVNEPTPDELLGLDVAYFERFPDAREAAKQPEAKKRKGKKKPKQRYQPPIPQQIMRKEMETMSKKPRTLADRNRDRDRALSDRDRDVQDKINRAIEEAGQIPTLRQSLEEITGPSEEHASELSRYGQQERRATEIVHDIINEYDLVLSLKQWQTVQIMMERAVMTGVQLELDS